MPPKRQRDSDEGVVATPTAKKRRADKNDRLELVRE
jgi:hypothetical protein